MVDDSAPDNSVDVGVQGRPVPADAAVPPVWKSIVPVLALVVLAVLATGVVVYNAGRELDAAAAQTSRHLASTALALTGERAASLATDYGFWDETIENAVRDPDPDWISTYLADYIFGAFDQDAVAVLGPDDAVLLWQGRTEQTPEFALPDLAALWQDLTPLIETARASPMNGPVGTWGLVGDAGRVFVVGVSAITPEFPSPAQLEPAPRPILAYFSEINAKRSNQIAERFDLAGLWLSGDPADAGVVDVPLASAGGRQLGYLHVVPDSPTDEFLSQVAWPVTGIAVLFCAISALVVRKLLSGHRDLQRSAHAIAQSNAQLIASEGQARSALQRAEHSARAKSGFLANVSHELRTPLTAIIGFSQILKLRHRPGTPPTREDEYANIIHQSSQHLLNLVNDLLDLGKIESGGYVLEESWFPINEEVDGISRMMAGDAVRRGVALATEIAPEAPELHADSRAVRQILTNLISNALKFTPSGGAAEAAVLIRDGRLALRVRDSGVGIAPGDLDQVWEPFNRTRNPAIAKTEGTGLGLHLVKILAELHDCETTLESTPGKGTTVTVTFPADRWRLT